jgi:phosphoribosylaminoimidazole carboxylase (NCAIR synthetase)
MSYEGATLGHKRVACLGGGQLGRMMGYKAHQMGIHLTCLDPKGELSPAGQVVPSMKGSFKEGEAIKALAKGNDLVYKAFYICPHT